MAKTTSTKVINVIFLKYMVQYIHDLNNVKMQKEKGLIAEGKKVPLNCNMQRGGW